MLYPKEEIHSVRSAGTLTATHPHLPASRGGDFALFLLYSCIKAPLSTQAVTYRATEPHSKFQPRSCYTERWGRRVCKTRRHRQRLENIPPLWDTRPGAEESFAHGLTAETHNFPPWGIISALFCLYRIPSRCGGCLLKELKGAACSKHQVAAMQREKPKGCNR